ncbi:putative disease resistance protein RGA1 [Spinacia oleracea]|uniref:Disease resistance protein RGA1 n=1 Tax=Spinacia oleracea TaxID=3562 RepID=A0ABM3RQR6_SPIOL|nr:putative disease resistance protein RGA1 [Spinacia oleracea]
MKLIQLWMAQGYIPLDDHLSMEDVAEEYFSILLQRCFFQDVKKDEYGSIESCKIHDLMHDVAQKVVGKEICANRDVDKNVRHLSVSNNESTRLSSTKTHIRSYLCFYMKMDELSVGVLLANWKYLRALDLQCLQIKSLPSSIGELLHLRYIDLSYNHNLELLPRSITKLHNLQTLLLFMCTDLKELPKDLCKLVNLRVLDLSCCYELSYMPRDIGKLTRLHTLNGFVVGDTRSNRKELFSGLEDLKALSNLKGYLKINIPFMNTSINAGKKNVEREGGCLANKENLKHVKFHFSSTEGKGREEYDEAIMGELQPNPNVKRFEVHDYHGVRMPRWPMEDNLATFLPNLVHVEFRGCPNLQYSGQLLFPLLKKLEVRMCPKLIVILQCPALEVLTLLDFNKRLKIIGMRRINGKESGNEKEKLFGEANPSGISSSSSSSSFSYDGLPLMEVTIDHVAWLHSLPMDTFLGVAKLFIESDNEVESLGEASEVFRSCSSSLISLKIKYCFKLRSVVFGGLEHLTALEDLEITLCNNLSLSEKVERGDEICMPWKSYLRSLKSVYLFNWIQYLTSLETLEIWDCERLESVPNWMSKLTSLKELQLLDCSERLMDRCQQSTGEDWSHIQHIPEFDCRPIDRNAFFW